MACLHNPIKLHFKLGLRYGESAVDGVNISMHTLRRILKRSKPLVESQDPHLLHKNKNPSPISIMSNISGGIMELNCVSCKINLQRSLHKSEF